MNRRSHQGRVLLRRSLGTLCSVSLLLSSCGGSAVFQPQPPRVLFYSMATESEDHYDLSRMILDQVRRFAQPTDFISIDQQQKGRASILFASPGDRREITAVAHALTKGLENDPEASLLEAVRRVRQYAMDGDKEIHALIITEGTDDAKTLETLKSINAEIAATGPDTVQSICILGLDPQLRQTTSSAFAPLKERTQSGQLKLEWQSCLHNMRF